ncbi:similar to Saccharomyces cerevisiae YNL234W Protein of unknown function with similarity to globins [Maudiozyma saulgeensis]|uniref:Globin domain-containing protein n=1 Tax=Maudiozyma saulgeensis TaxID=1789683 RepID=A0A1X7R2T1_9SACH|nr:similar to Saccharomyces cerevisiae YNL234W Protein of unknown function with similarity to globins [Kazachstania saulgeensis]
MVIDDGTCASITDSTYTTSTDTTTSSLATGEKSFDPTKANVDFTYTIPDDDTTISPTTSRISSSDPSSINRVSSHISRLSRTESLFKDNRIVNNGKGSPYDDDFDDYSPSDVDSVLTRPNKKIEPKFNKNEKILIVSSWNLILNDDLTENDLKKFSHMALILDKQSIQHHHRNNSRNGYNSSSSDVLEKRNSDNSGSKCSWSSFSNNGNDSTLSILKDTDFNRKGYDDSNIGKSLFCTQFFDNLVNIDQQMQQTYPTLRHQAVSFTILLNSAIQNLDDIKKIDDQLRSTGKRHTRILGIDNSKFQVMGHAFIVTLQDRLGTYFTPDLERLWSKLYSYLADSLLVYGVDPVLTESKSHDMGISSGNSIDFDPPEIIITDQENSKRSTLTIATESRLQKVRSAPVSSKGIHHTNIRNKPHHTSATSKNKECCIM